LAAVRSARAHHAQVDIVPFATTAAIKAALASRPAHVLHLSAHGAPGVLLLEDDTGAACRVSAEEFVTEAVPPGRMPAVVSRPACHSDAPGDDGRSFAAGLVGHGAAAVIGTEAAVTDRYATRLFARVYSELAQSPDPDVVAALAQARRAVQTE